MGTRYALDENYRPTSEEAAKDAAVGFFFGAVTSLLKSSGMTREGKARMSETVEQMKRDYGRILADSGGSVTLDALDDLVAKSAEVRNTLRTTQFAGQQDTVSRVMELLDMLDDAVEQARVSMGTGTIGRRGSMQALVPGGGGAAPGLPPSLPTPYPILGGAGTRGMPMLPSPAAVRDDWEVALEEAVAEQEEIDTSGGYGIIIGKGTEGAGETWGSTDNLIKSATTPGKGGVSPVGRAFQKHAGNPGRAGTFIGEVSGNAARNTEQGAQYISDILSNPQSTYKVRHTDVFGDILDVRLPDGTGARWSADGKTFIGFLEKYSE